MKRDGGEDVVRRRDHRGEPEPPFESVGEVGEHREEREEDREERLLPELATDLRADRLRAATIV